MTRPSQLRRIVALLRAERPDAEYRHLLRLAAFIIESHRKPEIVDYAERPSRPSFFALEVDKAFRRGAGFGVVNFEWRQGMTFGDERSDNHYRTEARLRGLIGRVSWPRTGTD
jgi:hypothetical protein